MGQAGLVVVQTSVHNSSQRYSSSTGHRNCQQTEKIDVTELLLVPSEKNVKRLVCSFNLKGTRSHKLGPIHNNPFGKLNLNL